METNTNAYKLHYTITSSIWQIVIANSWGQSVMWMRYGKWLLQKGDGGIMFLKIDNQGAHLWSSYLNLCAIIYFLQ